MKKVVISGGGTGGHIFPAVAIANEIKRRYPDAKIKFVGALGKMEMEKVPKAGYEILGLPIAGFNRSNYLANLSLPFKVIKSFLKARSFLKHFKPDIVVGVGGFASGPTLAMAQSLGIKTLIQEQNSFAGFTNKYLSKKVGAICVAYPGMEKFFPSEKIIFTGNPVRSDIYEKNHSKEDARVFFELDPNRKTLLVIGGSLGARSINIAIKSMLNSLISNDIQLIWQTGKNFIDEAENAVYSLQTNRVFVSEFIYTMPEAYAAADLVVSRAGALSVSEIAVLNKVSILVPYPFAAEDHQTQNAKNLADSQAAILVKDEHVNSELESKILELFSNQKLRGEMSQNVNFFSKPNATKDIVNEIEKLIKK